MIDNHYTYQDKQIKIRNADMMRGRDASVNGLDTHEMIDNLLTLPVVALMYAKAPRSGLAYLEAGLCWQSGQNQ